VNIGMQHKSVAGGLKILKLEDNVISLKNWAFVYRYPTSHLRLTTTRSSCIKSKAIKIRKIIPTRNTEITNSN